ncbi:MAG: hypothetical protein A2048_01250 [Deltaproteobacteria bacterium GWA2_45_12]|nr:MAG: hypothetical protein A2048_01250 [Deltaproteobacteria bacterium GWA2_45_12]
MCGAVSIQYDPALREELIKFLSEDEIKKFERNGEIVFAYWDKRPLLPIRQGNTIRILDWGNRDDKVPLPKTGWARLESLLAKKWERLKPKVVLIPAQRGCEKKVWFDLDKDIKAVLIQKDGMERVYMITEAATPEFKALTGHDRMPRLTDQYQKEQVKK